MKKWMNTLFFGSFFIAAVLIEIYSIIVLDGNLFSTISLGIVVMITGFLFMDSIRNALKQGKEEAKFYMDRVLSEEAEKWNERYTELLNLQKASYTATKKNTAALTQQFEEVLARLQEMFEVRLKSLEENNAKALQRITELQKKSLEGQKNALNLEINYNKENTKQIISILQEKDNIEINEQLSRILNLLEQNNELLQSRTSYIDTKENSSTDYLTDALTELEEDNYKDRTYKDNTYKEDTFNEDPDKDGTEQVAAYQGDSYNEISYKEDAHREESYTEDTLDEGILNQTTYKQEAYTDASYETGTYKADTYKDDTDKGNSFIENTFKDSGLITEDFYQQLDTTDHIEDEVQEEENASEPDWSFEEPELEAVSQSDITEDQPKVVPLYDDPNKSLTADEIAKLFASFGK